MICRYFPSPLKGRGDFSGTGFQPVWAQVFALVPKLHLGTLLSAQALLGHRP